MIVRIAFFLILGVCASGLAINDVPKLTFDELVAQSELIVIANGHDRSGPIYADELPGLSVLSVVSHLKGSSKEEIVVLTKPHVIENAMRCCLEGERYILFLKESQDDVWVGTNGPYSAVRIPDR